MDTDAVGPPAVQPTWLREVETAVVTNAQVLLYGNVRDQYLLPAPDGGVGFFSIRDALWSVLSRIGSHALVSADAVGGLTVDGRPPAPGEWEPEQVAKDLLGKRLSGGPPSLEALGAVLRDVAAPPARQRVGIVMEYAARLVRGLPGLDPTEHLFFALCEKLANTTLPLLWLDGTARYNPVIWVVQHERELPTWLLASGEGIRRIAVPVPELHDRLTPPPPAGPAGGAHRPRRASAAR